LIVKLDDMGLYLETRHTKGVLNKLGQGLLWFAPQLMKTLSVVGTAAMFLVGGSILVHGLPFLHHYLDSLLTFTTTVSALSIFFIPVLLNLIIGMSLGGTIFLIIQIFRLLKKFTK